MKRNIQELIKRYEMSLESGKHVYFDADEFEELIEYFDSHDDIDTAREAVDAGLAIHPESSPLLFKKAKLAIYDGEYLEALRILGRAATEYDYDLYLMKIECFLQLDLYAEAYALTKELLEKDEEESTDNILAELGFLYVEADYFQEAILYFTESLKYSPENIDVLSDMAYAYEMTGDFDGAIETSNKILDIEPYTYEAWMNLGKLYSLKDEFEKAIDAFDFALTINDSDDSVLKLKAHCLSLSGRTIEAIALFRDIHQRNNEDTNICLLLAECYQSLDMYDEASAQFDKYEELEGKTEELISKKAYLQVQKGELNIALDSIREGLLIYPESSVLNMLGGEIKFRQKKYAEAEKYYLKIYSSSPLKLQLLDKLSIICIKKGNYAEALNYTQKLLNIDSEDLLIKQRLTLLHLALGNKKEFEAMFSSFTDEEVNLLLESLNITVTAERYDKNTLIAYLTEANQNKLLFKNI